MTRSLQPYLHALKTLRRFNYLRIEQVIVIVGGSRFKFSNLTVVGTVAKSVKLSIKLFCLPFNLSCREPVTGACQESRLSYYHAMLCEHFRQRFNEVILLSCHSHDIVRLLSCYCHVIVMLLSCYCHAIAIAMLCEHSDND